MLVFILGLAPTGLTLLNVIMLLSLAYLYLLLTAEAVMRERAAVLPRGLGSVTGFHLFPQRSYSLLCFEFMHDAWWKCYTELLLGVAFTGG